MVSEDYFMVHPAFINDVESGGWDTELAGIWVGKYEASLANKADGSNIDSSTAINILLSDQQHADKTIVAKPGYSSWRYIQIGNMYENARYYSTELESHMLKNSEWGAVAYLTESKYGRNGQEVTQNTNSNYYTGGGTGTEYITNAAQSSTGNVYGIYDLSGGALEYVAMYYNGTDISTGALGHGSSFASINGESNQYATAYNNLTLSSVYRYGDATYETATWHSEYHLFIYSYAPYLRRGGKYDSTDAGIFNFGSTSGYTSSWDYSFRLALCVE